MASTPSVANGKTCQTPGCLKPLRARGFCVACYYRLLRHGELVRGSQTSGWKHRLSDINEQEKMAVCAACGPVKILRRGKNSSQWRCSTDANERSKKYKQAYRQSKKEMLVPFCEICGESNNLCWDHNHATGEFRGTLCSRCNTAIGMFDDDHKKLLSAARYLSSRP